MCRHRRCIAIAGIVILTALSAEPGAKAQGCRVDDPAYFDCERAQTTYQFRLPPFYKPSEPIPTVVVLHDAGDTGADIVEDPRLISAFVEKGYALLAPDALRRTNARLTFGGSKYDSLLAGSGMSRQSGRYAEEKFLMRDKNGNTIELEYGEDTGWYYYNIDRMFFRKRAMAESEPGSRYVGFDEIERLREVLRHSADKNGTGRTPEVIVGLGHGGSLVWQIACHAPELARLFAPVDGAYWENIPGRCNPGAKLVHTHSRANDFWPIDGAGGGSRYFNRTSVYENIEMMLRSSGCDSSGRSGNAAEGSIRHTVWSRCISGGSIELITMDEPFRFQEWWAEEIIGRLEQPDLEGTPVLRGPLFSNPGEKPKFAKPGNTQNSRFKRIN